MIKAERRRVSRDLSVESFVYINRRSIYNTWKRIQLAFDGPGDGIPGCLYWRLRRGSPVPSLFRCHNSGQFSMADCSRSPPQASLFCPLWCSSLLSLIWVLFEPPFLGSYVAGLCFHGPLPSPLRLDYLLLGFWLSHWMVCYFL